MASHALTLAPNPISASPEEEVLAKPVRNPSPTLKNHNLGSKIKKEKKKKIAQQILGPQNLLK
jgi:hypothetical protein